MRYEKQQRTEQAPREDLLLRQRQENLPESGGLGGELRNQEGKEVFYMKETPDDKQADVPGRYIDLHTHSTYSDGTNTPAEIVRHAKETGLSAITYRFD